MLWKNEGILHTHNWFWEEKLIIFKCATVFPWCNEFFVAIPPINIKVFNLLNTWLIIELLYWVYYLPCAIRSKRCNSTQPRREHIQHTCTVHIYNVFLFCCFCLWKLSLHNIYLLLTLRGKIWVLSQWSFKGSLKVLELPSETVSGGGRGESRQVCSKYACAHLD